MSEIDRSLVRNPELVVASVYEREIGASLERVWENVYDWEHLPWLHSEAFGSIEELASGEWGWHARVELAGGAEAEIELVTDRDARHYVARTLDGAGAPGEIWTSLDPVADDRTAIRVEFCVTPMPDEALRKLGSGYVSLYTLLWAQDEDMMQTRERALGERRPGASASSEGTDESQSRRGSREGRSISLGRRDDLLARLPLVFEFDDRRFRVVELDGEFVAHSVECPHLLGPLDGCDFEDGLLVCPWHGYRFDLRTGESAEGRKLRLRPAPTISIDDESGEVSAHAALGSNSSALRDSA